MVHKIVKHNKNNPLPYPKLVVSKDDGEEIIYATDVVDKKNGIFRGYPIPGNTTYSGSKSPVEGNYYEDEYVDFEGEVVLKN